MKKVRMILTILMAMLMFVLLLNACSQQPANNSAAASTAAASAPANSEAATSAPSTSQEFMVGFANNNDIYDYCAKFRDYLVADSKEKGIKLIVTDAKGDTNVQNGQIDDLIVQGCKAVSAIFNDLDGSVPALQAAEKANLPCISFLTTINGANDYSKFIYIGSQNYDAGKMQGEYLVKALPQNAQIIYFTGQPNDQQYKDRKAGLMDVLKQRTDVKILAEYNVQNQKDLGMSTTEDCLQAFPKFDAIVCQNDDSALGVVEALKSANRLSGVITVGIDGSDAGLASVKAGELSMTVLQDAAAQAQAGADVFAKIRDGVDPSKIDDILVPFQIVTKDNVDQFIKK